MYTRHLVVVPYTQPEETHSLSIVTEGLGVRLQTTDQVSVSKFTPNLIKRDVRMLGKP